MAELKLFHKILIFIAVVVSLIELAKLGGKIFDKKKTPAKVPPMTNYDSVPEAMFRRYGHGFRDDGTPQKAPTKEAKPFSSCKPTTFGSCKPKPLSYATVYPAPSPMTYIPPVKISEPEPEREIFYIRGLD